MKSDGEYIKEIRNQFLFIWKDASEKFITRYMTWFTLALIPPIFWAISNIVDSYISKNKERNIWESLIIVNFSKIPFLLVFG